MSNGGNYRPIPATFQPLSRPPGDSVGDSPAASGADPRVPLLNLSIVRDRMDSLQRFLYESVNGNTLIGKDQMDMVSSEISTAIHQIIVNGAALLSFSQSSNLSSSSQSHQKPPPEIANPIPVGEVADLKFSGDEDVKIIPVTDEVAADLKIEPIDEEISDEWEIMELDAVELLAEHVHFCDICGKGFKRDANLRMHMRAHGNQFKTPEALAKPERIAGGVEPPRRPTRFSCPFLGCNRNKSHKKFRPLKSVICVKNHFKRSHCPKMYSCNRCNKKSFSVVADLKSHQKHCGESKWKCSCGTTFSRKDKLFGHMALFEGHMPAVVVDDDDKGKGAAVVVVDDEEEEEDDDDVPVKEMELGSNCSDNGLFDELLEGFGSIDNYCLQDILDSANGVGAGLNEFRSF